MDNPFKIPFYAKAALIFISVFAFVYVMYIGQDIIIPLVYATIIAILLNPMVNFLIRKKISKIFAITIIVILMLIVAGAILYLVFSRLSLFSESFPQFRIKITEAINQLVKWYAHEFDYSRLKVNKWISDTQSDAVIIYSYS
jgi:predicted PurR-regulated permease PerM